MEWYIGVLKKYTDFSGRARRKEFWMFVLINFIISIVLTIIDRVAGLTYGTAPAEYGILTTIYALAVLLPSIAVSIRRLHDINKPGLWFLIYLIPCVGFIFWIIFNVKEGDPGANQYGPDPKAAERGQGFPGAEPGYPTV